jgi:hypothetical protein
VQWLENLMDSTEGYCMSTESGDLELRNRLLNELALARRSRELGNEGRARVCARRAAGWAVESIYNQNQRSRLPEANAYRFLLWFKDMSHFPMNLREAARRLTTRIDEDFSVPFDEDPLADARMIVDWVLSENE